MGKWGKMDVKEKAEKRSNVLNALFNRQDFLVYIFEIMPEFQENSDYRFLPMER